MNSHYLSTPLLISYSNSASASPHSPVPYPSITVYRPTINPLFPCPIMSPLSPLFPRQGVEWYRNRAVLQPKLLKTHEVHRHLHDMNEVSKCC